MKADVGSKQPQPSLEGTQGYFPAGGGVYGYDSATSVLNNGEPSQNAILKLAKPIKVPVRQNIKVEAEFFKVGTKDVLADSPSLNSGRSASDEASIIFMLDGVRTRDVQ